jgi:hypothetical protein
MAYIERARQDEYATLQQIADALNNRGQASRRRICMARAFVFMHNIIGRARS